MMAACGIAQEAICRLLGVSRPTLEKRCRVELDTGLAGANAKVGASVFKMATEGPYAVRFQAARYWLACRVGWRDGDKTVIMVAKAAYEMTDDEVTDVIQRQEAYEREVERAQANGEVVVPFYRPPRRGRW